MASRPSLKRGHHRRHDRISAAGSPPDESSRVKQTEFPGRAFASEFIEVPVRHAAVHELREADDVGAHAQTSLEKIAEIDGADRRQAPLFDERQEQLPEQEQAVEQSREGLTFI